MWNFHDQSKKIEILTSRNSENRSNLEKNENKLVNPRYLGNIIAKFYKDIPVVAEIGLQVAKSTKVRAMLKLIVFCDSSKIFCCNPRQIVW